MKNLFRKIIAVALCFSAVFGFSVLVSAAETTVEYGSYPQSRVTDEATINSLNQLNAQFVSYGYYAGDGSEAVSSAKAGDFMKYADVTLGGVKYRGVKFTSYRPNVTYMPADADHTYQDNNGYEPNTVYWFKFEPIKWKVINAKIGLCTTEKILDSQAFCAGFDYDGNMTYFSDTSHSHLANEYAYSKVKSWINGNFISVAFSSDELSGINSDNGEKVYLLSKEKAETYFETNESRKTVGTDYAECQGLFANITTKCSSWMLTDSDTDDPYSGLKIKAVLQNGSFGQEDILSTGLGFRPAAMIDSVIPEYTAEFFSETSYTKRTLREDATLTKPNDPIREGYSFNGWDKTVPSKMPANNLEFHATWKKNSYKVIWNMNGQQKIDTIPYGDPITAPVPAEKKGYLFDGWDKEIPETMPANDLVINAIYEEIHAVSIKIVRQPTNKKYAYKDSEIDLKGLAIEATCTDGKKVEISDTTQFNIKGFDTKTVGQKKVTVEYQGCEAQFTITVAYTWWQNIIRILLLGFLWY